MAPGRVSLSQAPFTTGDYTDGQIHPLQVGSILWTALHSESWIDCDSDTRNYYLSRLGETNHFIGYVVSLKRGQVELTVIPRDMTTAGPGNLEMIAVTLDDVARFIVQE